MAEWLLEFDSGDLWRQVISSPRRAELLPELTDRHLEILAGVASGRTYRETDRRASWSGVEDGQEQGPGLAAQGVGGC